MGRGGGIDRQTLPKCLLIGMRSCWGICPDGTPITPLLKASSPARFRRLNGLSSVDTITQPPTLSCLPLR